MRVVSLFDGMGCGLVALKRAGIKVTEYHAFETDKYAIQIAKKNHPEIIHHGEINFMTDFSPFKGFDLLIGGSPCQWFSMAGKGLNFKDKRSQLFFEYLRAKKEIKPKYFLLENVKMKKEIQQEISKLMKCQPVMINSALVSAQRRERLYWCNWKVKQPKDKQIFLKDIIENGAVDQDKSYCIDANYYKGGDENQYFNKGRRQQVFMPSAFICAQRGRCIIDGKRNDSLGAPTEQRIETNYRAKSNCITSVQKDREKSKCVRSGGRGSIDRHEWDSIDDYHIRKLTVLEVERLQTIDDGYTHGVSNTQRYKMLGNGWTISVISHILQAKFT